MASGASRCIFHSDVGRALGFAIEKGEIEETYGVSEKLTRTYLHTVSIHVMGGIETVKAAFCYELPLAALLGGRGFLDRFKFTYDPSNLHRNLS